MQQSSLTSVTVGIPFYAKSDPAALRLAIDSILQQTYRVKHIHLIQDGPVPNILTDIVNTYTSQNSQISHLIIEKNSGLAYCLNISILNCKTPYYARMDSDDYSDPHRIEKQARYLDEHPQVEILGSFAKEYNRTPHEPDVLLKKVPETMPEIQSTFHYKAPMIHASVMYRHEVFAKIGLYNVNYRTDEDNDLWLRAIRAKVLMANIPEPLYYIGVGDQIFRRTSMLAITEASRNKFRLFTWSPKLNFLKCAFVAYRLLPTCIQASIYKRMR